MKESLRTFNFDRLPALHKKADEPYAIHAVVETPRGNRNKFAYDDKYGLMVMKQTLGAGLAWPCDFGFIPGTLGGDGDHLDVALLLDESAFPSCMVLSRLIGAIALTKNGVRNDRLIAVSLPMKSTQLWTDPVRTIGDLPEPTIEQLEEFFKQYPEEAGHTIELLGRISADEAFLEVRRGIKAWKKRKAA